MRKFLNEKSIIKYENEKLKNKKINSIDNNFHIMTIKIAKIIEFFNQSTEKVLRIADGFSWRLEMKMNTMQTDYNSWKYISAKSDEWTAQWWTSALWLNCCLFGTFLISILYFTSLMDTTNNYEICSCWKQNIPIFECWKQNFLTTDGFSSRLNMKMNMMLNDHIGFYPL